MWPSRLRNDGPATPVVFAYTIMQDAESMTATNCRAQIKSVEAIDDSEDMAVCRVTFSYYHEELEELKSVEFVDFDAGGNIIRSTSDHPNLTSWEGENLPAFKLLKLEVPDLKAVGEFVDEIFTPDTPIEECQSHLALAQLDTAQREIALRLMVSRSQDPTWLNHRASLIAFDPGLTDAQYSLANDWIVAASVMSPDDEGILETRGMLLYRTGRYIDAIELLPELGMRETDPAITIGILAMSHKKLGNDCYAGILQERMQGAMYAQRARYGVDDRAKSILKEVEDLIEGTR